MKRYFPITQKPFCCTPACLQMVLLRRKLPVFSQEHIGKELGLVVPKRYAKILPAAKTGKKPSSGWGTQVQKKEYSINKFFKKYKIPLKEKYAPLSKVEDVKTWIKSQIKKDKDILVCFNYKKLYKDEGEGHVSVIDSVSDDKIMLIDPEKNVQKFREVKITDLIKAIKYHGKNNLGGFWVISNIK